MRQVVTVVISLLASSDRLLYEHGYHAGNYADVVKHSVLVQLLTHMQRKKSPFVYVETHSGAGGYPLYSRESQTLAEHEDGISLLFQDSFEAECISLHPATEQLLDIMNQFSSKDDNLEQPLYPGSPLVASSLCRSQDSLILCEKEPKQFQLLQSHLGKDKRATLLQENGYRAMKRFENLRSEQRALVFIDPPYQMGSDSEQIASLVTFLRTHWRSARVAIWHPVSRTNRDKADRLYELVANAIGKSSSDCLATELYDDSKSHVGTGMLLVNPPYGIDDDLRDLLLTVSKALGNEGSAQINLKKL
jgi:23S rRNA (adenine2030-N6)-methyltransferase